MANHFIKKCECGEVISQCRCIGDHKLETIIKHDEHLTLMGQKLNAELPENNEPKISEVETINDAFTTFFGKLERIQEEPEEIPLFINFQYEEENLLGFLVLNDSNQAGLIKKMMKDGYTFRFGGEIDIENDELLSLSILTHTGKRSENYRDKSKDEKISES